MVKQNPLSAFMGNLDKIERLEKEVVLIDIKEVRSYGFEGRKHTFKLNHLKVDELAESIKDHGIITPLIVRKDPNGIAKYECLAGNTRLAAANQIGLLKVPCIIEDDCDDIKANQIMVSSNRQREHISIMEKAYMYRYEKEALERAGKVSKKAMVEALDDNISSIYRFIKATYLIEDLQELVDEGKIPLFSAEKLLEFSYNEQKSIYILVQESKYKLDVEVATKINKVKKDRKKNNITEDLTFDELEKLIIPAPDFKKEMRMTFRIPQSVERYFPSHFKTQEEKTDFLIDLIKKYAHEYNELKEA